MSERRQAYDFFEAQEASRRGKEGQREAEKARSEAIEAYALAEKLYRVELAKKIIEMIAGGTPATVAKDLARGDKTVSDLGYHKDVAEGMKDIAEQRAWRHTADRKDIQNLTEWSMKVAPLGEQSEPARRAA